MMMNPSKILFLVTLFSGTLISACSTSWLGAWTGLEINLLSFIPLMTNSKNMMSTEASLKYFLIQAIASSLFLFSVLLMHLIMMFPTTFEKLTSCLISSALFLKMGAAPFHFWFPGVMEGLTWINSLVLMTWQKIAPLMLLSYILPMNFFTSIVVLMSIIVGSLGGLNQTSMRKIMGYSSINHMGWMIGGMMTGENWWMLYFLIYSFLTTCLCLLFYTFNIFHLTQCFTMTLNTTSKFSLFLTLLSLGGLPPFLGFLPKWLIIQPLTDLNQWFTVTLMVITTLITLFFYLRLTFSSFLFTQLELQWTINPSIHSSPSHIILLTFANLAVSGLLLCTLASYSF
uniref:NADH-ubiquinone oxidoreductase chain 2 n=1 Tax=Phaneroptera nigroantennata TaxID=420848 RepID=A0A1W6LR99_9ORTH|nr:NADH dehydrogenase subunit 2 [Phaneroptera nigroantennata]ARN59033.1 NADH dehydrogenase subunit 2 [Phaneroptera nigroantennata]